MRAQKVVLYGDYGEFELDCIYSTVQSLIPTWTFTFVQLRLYLWTYTTIDC